MCGIGFPDVAAPYVAGVHKAAPYVAGIHAAALEGLGAHTAAAYGAGGLDGGPPCGGSKTTSERRIRSDTRECPNKKGVHAYLHKHRAVPGEP